MDGVIVFVFRYALRLILAWCVISVVAGFVIGDLIRRMRGGDD